MNNQELLFNLIKKLESGEIKFLASDSSPTTIRITLYEKGRKLESEEEFTKEIEIGNLELKERKGTLPMIRQLDYQEEWNKEFKRNYIKNHEQ